MFDLIKIEEDDLWAKVGVIGVGELGIKVINYALENDIGGVTVSVVDTNNDTLLKSVAPQRVKINNLNSEDTEDKINGIIKDMDMICLVGDIKSKNLIKKIAEHINHDGCQLTVCLIDEYDDELTKVFDTVIAVNANNLNLMFQSVRGVTDLIAEPGMVGLDFADIISVLKNAGKGVSGYGEATGEDATVEAVERAIKTIKDDLHGAKGILINIKGSVDDLSMIEVNEATTMVSEAVHEDAEIIWGVTADEMVKDVIKVVITATRFAENQRVFWNI